MEETPLSPVLLRFPLVDRATGLVTRPWQQWFIASWYRQGGANAPPNDALGGELGVLQGALEETQAALAQAQAELAATQAQLAATQAELAATQAELEATQAELEATQEDIDALLPDGTAYAVARYQVDGSGVEAAPLTVDASGNALLGTTTPGTSAQRALVLASGVAPTAAHPADAVQMWVDDLAPGDAALLLRPEFGKSIAFGSSLLIGSRTLPLRAGSLLTGLGIEAEGGAALQLSGTAGSALNVTTTGGTIGAPAVTPAEVTLLALSTYGHNGSAVSNSTTTQVRMRSEELFSSGLGSYIEFRTARLGSTGNATEKLRITAQGNVMFNPGTGALAPPGTNAQGVLSIKSGVAPTAAHPADAVQLWAADRGAVAGKSSLHVRTEDGTSHVLGDLVGIGTVTPTAALDVAGDTLRLRTARTPASATAAGDVGSVCWDANFLYVAVGTNQWKRAPLTTW